MQKRASKITLLQRHNLKKIKLCMSSLSLVYVPSQAFCLPRGCFVLTSFIKASLFIFLEVGHTLCSWRLAEAGAVFINNAGQKQWLCSSAHTEQN